MALPHFTAKDTELSFMIISLDAEKVFDKIEHPFVTILERLRIQWFYLNMIKANYSKPIANNKPNGEKLKAIRNKTKLPILSISSQYTT